MDRCEVLLFWIVIEDVSVSPSCDDVGDHDVSSDRLWVTCNSGFMLDDSELRDKDEAVICPGYDSSDWIDDGDGNVSLGSL